MSTERFRATQARPAANGSAQGRRTAPSPSKRQYTDEEKRRMQARREAMHRQKMERQRQAKLRKMRQKRLFRLCFLFSLVIVILYWCYVALAIHFRPNGTEDQLPLYLFKEDTRKPHKKYEAEEVCIGETKYLPVTFLENYIAISHFGDNKTRSFLICSTGEFVTFYVDTEEGIINGEHFSIKAKAILKDDVLHLPVEFFVEKMNCFEYGKNNPTHGADVLTYYGSREPGFIFNETAPSDPIKYDPSYKKTTTDNQT